jgi:hypothetical protein
MNNEPVAWMQVHYKDNKPTKFSKVQTWEDDIPLYNHPAEHDLGIAEAIGFEKGHKAASVKELTDEEIEDSLYVADITLDNLSDGDIPMERIKAFARAILRKAQEK